MSSRQCQLINWRAIARGENSLLSLRAQDSALSQLLLRQAKLFIIDEEERFVSAIKEFGNNDRPTYASSVLVEQDAVTRGFAKIRRGESFVVEIVVRRQRRLSVIPVEAATQIVRAAS